MKQFRLVFVFSVFFIGLGLASPLSDLVVSRLARALPSPVIKRYTFGNRGAGNILAERRSQPQYFWNPTNAVQRIRFTGVTQRLIVTQAVVSCEQIGNSGSGRITSGGIGQQYIEITVEARQTTRLNCSWQIYARRQ